MLIANWQNWSGEHSRLSHGQLLEHFATKYGYEADAVYIFDAGGACLSAAQLDIVRDSGFPPVLINLRTWGQDGSHDKEADRKAAMEHPHCLGVVIEGRPEALTRPKLRLNHRLQVRWDVSLRVAALTSNS